MSISGILRHGWACPGHPRLRTVYATNKIVLYQHNVVEPIRQNVNVASFMWHRCKDVDGGDKPGHDGI
jgi:hypothetical protein